MHPSWHERYHQAHRKGVLLQDTLHPWLEGLSILQAQIQKGSERSIGLVSKSKADGNRSFCSFPVLNIHFTGTQLYQLWSIPVFNPVYWTAPHREREREVCVRVDQCSRERQRLGDIEICRVCNALQSVRSSKARRGAPSLQLSRGSCFAWTWLLLSSSPHFKESFVNLCSRKYGSMVRYCATATDTEHVSFLFQGPDAPELLAWSRLGLQLAVGRVRLCCKLQVHSGGSLALWHRSKGPRAAELQRVLHSSTPNLACKFCIILHRTWDVETIFCRT